MRLLIATAALLTALLTGAALMGCQASPGPRCLPGTHCRTWM